jgi:hypothetical protein
MTSIEIKHQYDIPLRSGGTKKVEASTQMYLKWVESVFQRMEQADDPGSDKIATWFSPAWYHARGGDRLTEDQILSIEAINYIMTTSSRPENARNDIAALHQASIGTWGVGGIAASQRRLQMVANSMMAKTLPGVETIRATYDWRRGPQNTKTAFRSASRAQKEAADQVYSMWRDNSDSASHRTPMSFGEFYTDEEAKSTITP